MNIDKIIDAEKELKLGKDQFILEFKGLVDSSIIPTEEIVEALNISRVTVWRKLKSGKFTDTELIKLNQLKKMYENPEETT